MSNEIVVGNHQNVSGMLSFDWRSNAVLDKKTKDAIRI